MTTWGTLDDSLDQISTSQELAQALSNPLHYKVVTEINIGGVVYRGITLHGVRSTVITRWISGPLIWAHEFGHQKGLYKNTSCLSLIMCEPDPDNGIYACNDPQYELDPFRAEAAAFEANPDDATFDCNPTGAAAVESFVAVHESDGNHIRFSTYWEFESDSFAVQKFDPGRMTVASIVGTVPATGNGGSSSYDVLDPASVVGDRYKLVEHQRNQRGDLQYGTCEAQLPYAVVAQEPMYYNADSLAAVVAGYDTYTPDGMQIPSDPCTGAALDYAILCPDSFVTALGSYAGLWSARGVRVRIVSYTVADTCFGGYRDFIRWSAQHGTRYFLLAGDANDAAWWDDSTKPRSTGKRQVAIVARPRATSRKTSAT